MVRGEAVEARTVAREARPMIDLTLLLQGTIMAGLAAHYLILNCVCPC